MEIVGFVRVRSGDRSDLIAWRTLGDPEQAWHIWDANDAMFPPDLIVPGNELRIPAGEPPAALEEEEAGE